MEIASQLWAAGIKAEFGFKPNPKMGDQLNLAFENAIPFMVLFGEDEINKGLVKIKVSGRSVRERESNVGVW
jgi:histidyl-tRNA synthetase